MLEILFLILFGWLFVKSVGLAFKVAWGATKIVAVVMLALVCPVLIAGLLLVGAMGILLPAVLIGIAFGLLKKCV